MSPLDLSGTATPVALIADPFAYYFANASQMGNAPAIDGTVNPADLFPASFISGYFVLVILNSLSTSLRLVESYIAPADHSWHNVASQVNYPSSPADPGSTQAPDAHVILGTRPYPSPKKHTPPAAGGMALVGGLGVYSFAPGSWSITDVYGDASTFEVVQLALSFSAAEDGSGPLVAIAVRLRREINQVGPSFISVNSCVCADLTAKYSGLADFYGKTVGLVPLGPGDVANSYTPNHVGKLMTIWATYATKGSTNPAVQWTLTAWVRDIGSTLG